MAPPLKGTPAYAAYLEKQKRRHRKVRLQRTAKRVGFNVRRLVAQSRRGGTAACKVEKRALQREAEKNKEKANTYFRELGPLRASLARVRANDKALRESLNEAQAKLRDHEATKRELKEALAAEEWLRLAGGHKCTLRPTSGGVMPHLDAPTGPLSHLSTTAHT